METKLVRIAEISATSKHPIFTSVYHLINEDMLKQCHKELDGNKAVGIDRVTKDEYGKNLDRNVKELVQRLKNKSFKPLPSLRVYIPKGNGKKRPLGIASYEDKIVQMAVKKILGAIYEPRFLNCMYGFRPNRGCHEAIKEVYQRISYGKISYIVDADIKGFFDHIDHDWMMKFLEWNIQDKNLLWLIRKYLKAGIMEQGKFEPTEEGSAQGSGITLIVTVAFSISSMFYNISTDYPFFMVAFLQIVCFAGIYMKLGDLMSMFSLNAGDSQSMGRRIFRRPYLFMRHRARRMEHRIARAVSAGGISGGVAGAVAGSAVAGKRAERKNTASKENRGNTTSSMGQRAGSKVGAVLDTKNKVKDKANAVKENIKDMPTQTAYAVYSAKEKAKSSVSDFKRGMVQEQQSRQTGRLEKQEQRKKNIADKRMELQKAQEARQVQRKADGSATTGATRPHERPVTASTIPKPSVEKMQEVKRPATAPTPKASEPVKTNVIKERPLSSGASDKKATQPAQPVHRQNVEKVVSQETRQNYKAERTTKKQTFEQSKRTTEHTEKNRNLVTKKGQKKK